MKTVASAAMLFAALGDENRLRLISCLCHGRSMSIAALTAGSNLTRQAITKHLKLMERATLVRKQRRGRESLWHFDKSRLEAARRHLEEIAKQ
jgi:DNA-binding transcriptional ArsR family regulator